MDLNSTGFKKFMAMAYGLGGAIVILGALFKLMHWEFASEMLIIGLGTEAFIFVISAFEPLSRSCQSARQQFPNVFRVSQRKSNRGRVLPKRATSQVSLARGLRSPRQYTRRIPRARPFLARLQLGSAYHSNASGEHEGRFCQR